jgi:hypothetical protein
MKPQVKVSHTVWCDTKPADFNNWMQQVRLERLKTQYRLLEYDFAEAKHPRHKQRASFEMGIICARVDFESQFLTKQ